ncbi:hypothetical protein ABVT39_017857 [Epinephelus coioides]
MTRLFSLIQFYFVLGLRHWEILLSLSHVDGVIISLSTLCRHLKTLRLFRRKAHSDLLDIAVILRNQLDTYGKLHGYKMMHLKCIQAGYVVTQSFRTSSVSSVCSVMKRRLREILLNFLYYGRHNKHFHGDDDDDDDDTNKLHK